MEAQKGLLSFNDKAQDTLTEKDREIATLRWYEERDQLDATQ